MVLRKVAYNACFGGFSLSKEAVVLGQCLSGKADWPSAISRHDTVLIEVIETLGEKASGKYSSIRIAEVSGPYRIDEYDGNETVETPDSYIWVE